MFDFVQKNSLFIKVVLGGVALTFVGFGVGSYTAATDDPYLAKVDGVKIYKQDIERALNGRPADAATRQGVLENLVRKELLLADARSSGLVVSADELRRAILDIPGLQENGKFSKTQYELFLKSQGLSAPHFEKMIGDDLLIQKQLDSIAGSSLVSNAGIERVHQLIGQSREISAWVLRPQQFATEVKIDDEAVKAYYNAQSKRYQTPDMVRAQYVVLSQDKLAASIKVSNEEIRQYFEQHRAELAPEQRRVAHILIAAGKDADAAARTKAREQAEALLKELKTNPGRFAELARARSQDPGSAAQGGDLGYFAKGMMVKPFEDTAFKLAKGEMSGVVETDFGYHILRLDDIKQPDFAAVKEQVTARLQKQKATGALREQAEKLNELAYQQADSLKAASDTLKLPLETSDWLARDSKPTNPVLAHPKLLDALFSDDVLKGKHNSEAIEVAPGTLVVVRVAEHKPAAQKPLEEVAASIRQTLTDSKAAELASEKGKTLLATLKAGKAAAGESWGPMQTVSRQAPVSLSRDAARVVFSAPVAKLPAYAGAATDTGDYVIYRISKVTPAPAAKPEDQARLRQMLSQAMSNAEAMAYVESLRQRFKVVQRPITGGEDSQQ